MASYFSNYFNPNQNPNNEPVAEPVSGIAPIIAQNIDTYDNIQSQYEDDINEEIIREFINKTKYSDFFGSFFEYYISTYVKCLASNTINITTNPKNNEHLIKSSLTLSEIILHGKVVIYKYSNLYNTLLNIYLDISKIHEIVETIVVDKQKFNTIKKYNKQC